MPIFANYQIDLFLFLFFLIRIFVCQAVCLVLFTISSDFEICIGAAIYTCLLSSKLNHRLQMLGYDLTISASAHKF